MKRQRKKYETPTRPWDKERLERERELVNKYGLTKKREFWRVEAELRKIRRLARVLAAKKDKEKEKILVEKLVRLGLLSENATLDDVLGLNVENLLERRLQTLIVKKGFANTLKQVRKFIVHAKVKIGERKITFPSYIVPKNEEDKIQVLISLPKKE